MGGLILKLAPGERILINGAVIENGPRKTRLTVCSDDVAVLRLRDALHPDEAIGPASRAYHLAQLGVAGEAEPGAIREPLGRSLADLSGVFENTAGAMATTAARAHFAAGDLYQTMRALRPLLALEKRLLEEAVP